ncbi:MAG: hypothetical protein EAS51_12485 [Microbacteriaceae bacterium]|nr:MAG: hypothetical protein EAS51_12485 [Microbacteriaceae bacterium]
MTWLALMLSTPIAASATETPGESALQARIDAVLAEFPGGTQTAPNEIAWHDRAMILTLDDPSQLSPLSVGSCATGYHCAYSGYALSGSKLSLSACDTTVSTSVLSAVRSLANAHGSGYVQAKNSSGSVLASVSHGDSIAYAPAGITQLTCVS